MGKLLLVCAGGAIGSGARYLVAEWAHAVLPAGLPWGTAIVNVTGSFFIAAVLDTAARTNLVSPEMRLFLTTGIAGGFTTYSSFNNETLQLIASANYPVAVANVLGTLILCLGAGLLGILASRASTAALTRLALGSDR